MQPEFPLFTGFYACLPRLRSHASRIPCSVKSDSTAFSSGYAAAKKPASPPAARQETIPQERSEAATSSRTSPTAPRSTPNRIASTVLRPGELYNEKIVFRFETDK